MGHQLNRQTVPLARPVGARPVAIADVLPCVYPVLSSIPPRENEVKRRILQVGGVPSCLKSDAETLVGCRGLLNLCRSAFQLQPTWVVGFLVTSGKANHFRHHPWSHGLCVARLWAHRCVLQAGNLLQPGLKQCEERGFTGDAAP